ncbi:MAG: DUF3037 domain-containing protein [Chloroflexota bacterium]|nr:DUF3037 domain-containing protein [Chloroflexota bacterium]
MPFQWTVLQVVPRVERDERFNAGVILFCRSRRFLDAQVWLDARKLQVLDPTADEGLIRAHLNAMARIAVGDLTAGPIAALEQAERFHWLSSPSSTVIQPSAVHGGVTTDPSGTLERLFRQMVAPLDSAVANGRSPSRD